MVTLPCIKVLESLHRPISLACIIDLSTGYCMIYQTECILNGHILLLSLFFFPLTNAVAVTSLQVTAANKKV